MTAPTASASGAVTRGEQMLGLIETLFPLLRSITGAGLRETLRIVGEHVPITIHEVPTGSPALDWRVPREWDIRDAYVADPSGRRVIDLADSTLHVVGYSTPVRATMTLDELRPHLHTLPDQPTRIPWRTSYYREDWGFCLRHDVLEAMDDGPYEVVVDSELREGSLSYGELVLPGSSTDEILVSAHACHPSMANDNLSGIAVATFLGLELADRPRHHTIRILFAPGTIGALAWLERHQDDLRIRHGLVLAGVGDAGDLHYKRSRRGDAIIDRALAVALRDAGVVHAIRDFEPWGYDERQYGSPGFDLPVGLLMRTPHGTYPEYHTSGDDLAFVHPGQLEASLDACLATIAVVERAAETYRNTQPKGEPELGRRGLYDAIGGRSAPPDQLALLWVLNQSDGSRSLLDIAERSGLAFEAIAHAADALAGVGLLSRESPA